MEAKVKILINMHLGMLEVFVTLILVMIKGEQKPSCLVTVIVKL